MSCVQFLTEKGADELLPQEIYSVCAGIWVEENGGQTSLRCYTQNVETLLSCLKTSGLRIENLSVRAEEEKDYAALVKKYFRPFTIEGVTILPPWDVPRAGARARGVRPFIVIDPGMAFGTGRHESTKLMMKMIRNLELRGRSVLDIGCGSAILSLYARLRGAEPVVAVDIDPDAVFSARNNLHLNNATTIALACADLALLRGTFDVVLANLDYETFGKHLPLILRRVAPGGCLVVSGIESQFGEAFLEHARPLIPAQRRRMNSWYGFVFKIDNGISAS